jgi:hypothetical protein
MDFNFPVFDTGVRIFRASNDVGPLILWIQFYWTSTTLGENNPYVSDTPVHIFIIGVEHV